MDRELTPKVVADARAGKAAGLAALLDAYGNRLYGYFYRAVGNHHDAEDLLSDLSLRLVKKIQTYDERGKLEHWIFRIAANLVRDRFRRKKVRPKTTSLSVGADDDGTGLAGRIEGQNDSVDHELLLAEASDEINQALAKLDDTTREMILLRHFGEMSFKDIAAAFDCPIGTALAKVHRGLKALRGHMETDNG